MKKFYSIYLYIFIVLGIIFNSLPTYAYQQCDTSRSCIGNALTLAVTQGKGAQYVDIDQSPSTKSIKKYLTVDFWMKPEKQTGTKQFIAGLWGPGYDKNDSWVLYFTPSDSLVFQVNGNRGLKQFDDIIVKINGASLYNSWNHIYAVFDGDNQSAYIYVNGIVIDSAKNLTYPVSSIASTQDNLPIQIGSCNGFSDDKNNRTFKGQIDEFRIWGKLFTNYQLYCQKDLSLVGTEADLMVYFRFNELPWNFDICDASSYGNKGRARSGARCDKTDRSPKRTIFADVAQISDTLMCDTTKTWTITVTDTSICGSQVWMRVIDELNKSYTITPANLTLNPTVPTQFRVKLTSGFVGTINSRLQIISYNSCGSVITIPLKITRMTELRYSKAMVSFDTVIAGCKDQPYIDSVIKICNNTSNFGASKDMHISSITNGIPSKFQIIAPPTPITIPPGGCIDITVRYYRGDKTASYFDTLSIRTDDKCGSNVKIPLFAASFEAIMITRDYKTRLDTINFGTICLNYASPGIEYYWYNTINKVISVDTIIVPDQFTGKPLVYPFILNPKWGYRPNYFRFMPTKKGNFLDSARFIFKAGGCTVERKVYLKGRGFFADLKFNVDTLNFGTELVGKEKQLTTTITNNSTDTLTFRLYLRRAENFIITGGNGATLLPGKSFSFTVMFRPIGDSLYFDELCYFETKCQTSGCLTLRGQGIKQIFDFTPLVMITENVIGCSSLLDTLIIKNISGSKQTLNNFVFNDPGGRYLLVNPLVLPNKIDLNDGEKAEFIYNYVPNDVLNEHADKAFLRFKTLDGQDWLAKLYGSSLIPKLFVTDLKVFGTLEVGDKKRDTLLIENISPFPVHVDSINVPKGYNIVYPNKIINKTLNHGDTINLIVDFLPDSPGTFNGKVDVFASNPCSIVNSGLVKGEGIIVPLEVPLSVISFGFVNPCNCRTRELPLINQSLAFPMTIDSIWIDSTNVINGTPEFFTWRSFYSPNGKLPYQIPKMSFDTVWITYCPRTLSLPQYVDNGAKIHIKASGSQWNRNYESYLVGKRALFMQPSPSQIGFPPTRVDTFSTSRYDYIFIPDYKVNPERANLKLDSITFLPDERVFYAKDTLGRPFPLIIDSTKMINIKVDFKPRAVRKYTARMVLHFSDPCYYSDTTVLVTGSGFAPAYGLNLSFNQNKSTLDTFRFISCDTLEIPVYTSREIPAEVIDINTRLGYDTTKLKLVGLTSPYTKDTCKPHIPNLKFYPSVFGGYEVLVRNLCHVDNSRPFVIARFIALANKRDTIKITVDSTHFDTEDILLYNLIAAGDFAEIIILQPDMKVLNSLNFDSVQVLDCSFDTILVKNTGDVPILMNPNLKLPPFVQISSIVPPIGDSLFPSQTGYYILKYCPRKKDSLSNEVLVQSDKPCPLIDSIKIVGTGYAPLFNFITDISNKFIRIDTINASLGDTITVPIMFDKDFSAIIRGTEYWLENLRFKVYFDYNKFAMEFLEINNYLSSQFNYNNLPGRIILDYKNVDSLRAGKLADLKFLITVPDSITTGFAVNTSPFESDSIMFVDIVPLGSYGFLITKGSCNLTTLQYSTVIPGLQQNKPNPWSNSTAIDFTIQEKQPVFLKVFNSKGELITTLIDGMNLKPGDYSVQLNSNLLNSGVYFYTLQCGLFYNTKMMVLSK